MDCSSESPVAQREARPSPPVPKENGLNYNQFYQRHRRLHYAEGDPQCGSRRTEGSAAVRCCVPSQLEGTLKPTRATRCSVKNAEDSHDVLAKFEQDHVRKPIRHRSPNLLMNATV